MSCSNCSDPNCNGNNCSTIPRRFFITEVEESVANTCSQENQCPFNTPFFDETLANSGFVISAVGSTFIIQVCDNSRWAIGQWVKIPNAGRFEIVSKDGCNNIHLRNGCNTDEAIPGNVEPGTNFNGTHKVIPSNYNCSEDNNDDFCNVILDEIASCEQELCKILQSIENGQDYYLVASSFVEGDEDALNCFKKATNILVKENTICFSSLPSNSLSKIDDIPVQDVQIIPPDNCLAKRSLPSNPAVDIYCDGGKQYLEVPSDWEDKQYVLGVNDSTGCPDFVENGCDTGGLTFHPTGLETVSTFSFNPGSSFASIINLTQLPDTPDCATDLWVELGGTLIVSPNTTTAIPQVAISIAGIGFLQVLGYPSQDEERNNAMFPVGLGNNSVQMDLVTTGTGTAYVAVQLIGYWY